MSFVHLGVRSEYAIVDSIVKIKELIKAAVDDGQTALGITDFKNTFALVNFIKPALVLASSPCLAQRSSQAMILAQLPNMRGLASYSMP